MHNERAECQRECLDELRLRIQTKSAYALVDACDEPSVPEIAAECGSQRAISVVAASEWEPYWSVFPYLFTLDEDLMEWILAFTEEAWGIIAFADVSIFELQKHFQDLLVVAAPNGDPWFFRYYDPQVLEMFMRASNGSQQRELFGPVSSFATLVPKENSAVVFHRPEPKNPRKIFLRRS